MHSSSFSEPSTIAAFEPVEQREGIARAFDVIRNHTVHTKGYVLTALQLIEEFGSGEDKALLNDLLRSKNGGVQSAPLATSDTPLKKPKPLQKKK